MNQYKRSMIPFLSASMLDKVSYIKVVLLLLPCLFEHKCSPSSYFCLIRSFLTREKFRFSEGTLGRNFPFSFINGLSKRLRDRVKY